MVVRSLKMSVGYESHAPDPSMAEDRNKGKRICPIMEAAEGHPSCYVTEPFSEANLALKTLVLPSGVPAVWELNLAIALHSALRGMLRFGGQSEAEESSAPEGRTS